MTLYEIIDKLERIRNMHAASEAEVNVMIETDSCQYEFPANDIAYSSSSRGERVIIMHEKWNGNEINGDK